MSNRITRREMAEGLARNTYPESRDIESRSLLASLIDRELSTKYTVDGVRRIGVK